MKSYAINHDRTPLGDMGTEKTHRYIPIKQWSPEERPRERLLHHGKKALTNAELIAILLRSGNKQESAVDLARKLLAACNHDLNRLAKMDVREMMKINGMGLAKSLSLVAAFELARRRDADDTSPDRCIHTADDAYMAFRPHLSDLDHEEFWILLLNKRHKPLRTLRISAGGFDATVVDPRMIFRHALLEKATALIIAHNHPSGALRPSRDDIRLTERIYHLGEQLNITLLDHLIIGHNRYLTFKGEGYAPFGNRSFSSLAAE